MLQFNDLGLAFSIPFLVFTMESCCVPLTDEELTGYARRQLLASQSGTQKPGPLNVFLPLRPDLDEGECVLYIRFDVYIVRTCIWFWGMKRHALLAVKRNERFTR